MPTILISGAGSGLGLAFLKAYLQQPDTRLIAVDIAPIPFEDPRIQAITVDVASEASISHLESELHDSSIDLVIHSAGVRGLVSSAEDHHPDDVAACETLAVMDATTLERAYHVNVVGTFLLLRALVPHLVRATQPKVIVMASRMGSLGNNAVGIRAAGSAYAYRASKAGQIAVVRSLAVDVPTVTFVLCHPGRVETNLVRCREEGAIDAEEAVSAVMRSSGKWGPENSGQFFDRFGDRIQW